MPVLASTASRSKGSTSGSGSRCTGASSPSQPSSWSCRRRASSGRGVMTSSGPLRRRAPVICLYSEAMNAGRAPCRTVAVLAPPFSADSMARRNSGWCSRRSRMPLRDMKPSVESGMNDYDDGIQRRIRGWPPSQPPANADGAVPEPRTRQAGHGSDFSCDSS